MGFDCGGCGKDLTKKGTLNVWLSGRQEPVPGHMVSLGDDGMGGEAWNAKPEFGRSWDLDYCSLEAYCGECGAQSA